MSALNRVKSNNLFFEYASNHGSSSNPIEYNAGYGYLIEIKFRLFVFSKLHISLIVKYEPISLTIDDDNDFNAFDVFSNESSIGISRSLIIFVIVSYGLNWWLFWII